MIEKIRKISRGHIDTEFPVVSIEPLSFEEMVSYGDVSKSEFHINCENRLFVRGFVYSSNPKVTLNTNEFSGVFNHIGFNVDASRLDDGEIIRGNFYIVSNGGEYVIPYSFTVVSTTSEGNRLITLNDFYSLYKTNNEKACELFNSTEFIYMPFMLDPSVRAVYDGLQSSSIKEKSISEFFIAFGLSKRPIMHSFEESVSVSEASKPPVNRISSIQRRALRYETTFDHAKIRFETNDVLRKAALQEMRETYNSLLNIGFPIKGLELHEAEIKYYENYNRSAHFPVDHFSSLTSLRRCFERGCRSPYLYLEACKAYRYSADLIKGFNEFTINALNFGSKYTFLSNEIAEIVGRHAQISNDISSVLLYTMKRMYKNYSSYDLLAGIVSTLIKKDDKSADAFTWYLKGVKEDVKISKLYDYLIESMPDDYLLPLPDEVYMYYSYKEPSGEESKKKFYYNVISNYDESSDIYQSFSSNIRRFVTNEVYVGNIDEKLAKIYNLFLHVDMVDEKTAEHLPEILMMHKVESPSKLYKKLIVLYEELEGEQVADISSGEVLLPIYTDNYHLLAEDIDGVRYYDEKLTAIKLITNKDNLFYACARWAPSMPSYRIKEANRLIEIENLSSDELQELRRLAVTSGIHPLFKTKINYSIINHYSFTNNDQNSAAILECSSDKFLSDSDRAKLTTVFIRVGLYDDAINLIRRNGYRKIEPNELSKVVSYYISQNSSEFDESVLDQAFYLFKKSYTNNYMLEYLCKYYNGLSKDMYDIMQKSASEMVPLSDMPERLLSQMIFTNSCDHLDDVFKCYASGGSVDKNMLNAYYVIKCTRYFVHGEDFDNELFNAVKGVLINQIISGNAPTIIQIAVSKYYSELEDLSEEDRNVCDIIVKSMLHKGIVFPHFKKLSKWTYIPEELQDKTIFTYTANDGDSVTLILVPEDDDEEPVYLEMNYVCCGIFVRPVLLFEGEHQSYQVRVSRDGKSQIVREGELKADILLDNNKRIFVRLNKLLEESDNPSDESFIDDMSEYAFDKALVNLLFNID